MARHSSGITPVCQVTPWSNETETSPPMVPANNTPLAATAKALSNGVASPVILCTQVSPPSSVAKMPHPVAAQ